MKRYITLHKGEIPSCTISLHRGSGVKCLPKPLHSLKVFRILFIDTYGIAGSHFKTINQSEIENYLCIRNVILIKEFIS